MPEHFREMIIEMCKRVKCDYNTFNFDQKEWFCEYQWTDKEQDEYRKWAIDYLKKNKKARREIMSVNSSNKIFLERAINMFLLNWGWKTKNNK